MVHVDAHPNGFVLEEDPAEFRCYTLGKKNRNARSDSDEFDMFNRVEAFQQVIDFLIGQSKGVTPADKNIADLRRIFQVFKGLFYLRVEVIALGVADKSTSCTISAISCAAVGD